jgi:hypothetical protein
MVNKREPAKAEPAPSIPAQSNQQPNQPEFGKSSALQSPIRKSIFNIPKVPNARPEHHRPPGEAPSKHGFMHPFRALVPNAATDSDIIEIPRPAATPAWSTYEPQPQIYSSFGGFTSVNAYRRGDTDPALIDDRFGSADTYNYVDAAKATENIKALLEGAFDEDDEDAPRTRGRKRKVQEKAAGLVDKLKGLAMHTEEKKTDEVEEEEDDGSIEGMKVKLLPHQVDGVSWMTSKENGSATKKKNGTVPKGGILADDVCDSLISHILANEHIDGPW